MLWGLEKYLPERVLSALQNAGDLPGLQEIRLRALAPLCVIVSGKGFFIDRKGRKTSPDNGVTVYREEIEQTLAKICDNSVYSYEEQLLGGFVTTRTGIRVGISGTAVMSGDRQTGIRDINSLVFRISRDVAGCSAGVFREIFGNGQIHSTVIASPPGCGKTTLIRDLARNYSGAGVRTCVIDERNEIFAVKNGIPAFDAGPMTDIMSMFPKGEGVRLSVRSLSPQMIICDEISGEKDALQLLEAMNCGCGFVVTVHAGTAVQALRRSCVKKLVDGGAVDRLVILGKNFIRNNMDFEVYDVGREEDPENHENHSAGSDIFRLFPDGNIQKPVFVGKVP